MPRVHTHSGLRGLGDPTGDPAVDALAAANAEIPGTGQTVNDLLAIGYTADDIEVLLAANDVPTSGSSVIYGPPKPGQPGSHVNTVSVPQLPAAGGSSSGLPPGPAPRVNVPLSTKSFGQFFTGSTLISGVPNFAVIGGLGAALLILPWMFSGGGRRRR